MMAVFLDDSVPNQRFDTVVIEQLLLNVSTKRRRYIVNDGKYDTVIIERMFRINIYRKRYIGNSNWRRYIE